MNPLLLSIGSPWSLRSDKLLYWCWRTSAMVYYSHATIELHVLILISCIIRCCCCCCYSLRHRISIIQLVLIGNFDCCHPFVWQLSILDILLNLSETCLRLQSKRKINDAYCRRLPIHWLSDRVSQGFLLSFFLCVAVDASLVCDAWSCTKHWITLFNSAVRLVALISSFCTGKKPCDETSSTMSIPIAILNLLRMSSK